MENVNPALQLVSFFRLGLERGESLRFLFALHAKPSAQQLLAHELREWLHLQDQGMSVNLSPELATPSRKAALDLLQRGLRGEAILPALRELEKELYERSLEQLEEHAALLPFLALPPLLLLQFPALMILILLPLLESLSKAI